MASQYISLASQHMLLITTRVRQFDSTCGKVYSIPQGLSVTLWMLLVFRHKNEFNKNNLNVVLYYPPLYLFNRLVSTLCIRHTFPYPSNIISEFVDNFKSYSIDVSIFLFVIANNYLIHHQLHCQTKFNYFLYKKELHSCLRFPRITIR